jgi:hypothetical protein
MIERMFENLAATELVMAIADSQRQESMLMAERMSAVAELLTLRTAQIEDEDPDPGYMVITGFQRTTAEVAAAMNLSPSAASSVVTHADALKNRLPAVGAVLATGDTDWQTVKLIIARTEFVSDSVITRLDESLTQRILNWHSWSRRRVINAVDAAVRIMDPDAIRERKRQEDKRGVEVTALGDGTAKIDGIVAVKAGIAFDKRLTELANGVCRNDPRTFKQRRADATEAMAEGRPLACQCGANTCPNRNTDAAPTRVIINVIASEQTLCGNGQQPGYIEGYGVIDAEQVRAIATDATVRLIEEPSVSPADALRYQPSAAGEGAAGRRGDAAAGSAHRDRR